MNIDAQPDYVIDDRIDDPSGAALLISQTRKLTIRVVENIRHHMKGETDKVEKKNGVEIKTACDDSENAADKSDSRRREFEMGKELSDPKTDFSVKEKIGNSFELP